MTPALPGPLVGPFVTLEPLSSAHLDELLTAADDPALFTWSSEPVVDRPSAAAMIDGALRNPDRLPLLVRETDSGRAIGSTSFYGLEPAHRALTLGYTWYSSDRIGTVVNPATKLLVLQQAFDGFDCVRVQWTVDETNTRSRRALEKLGATEEGLLRKHRLRRDGSWRTTVLYAVTDDDWPSVRAGLTERLAAFG